MAKIRILVVDDAVMMRRLITKVVESDPDIEVAGVAANGSIALQRIEHLKPDLVTMDVEMPDMDGIETVRKIRKNHPRLPIIMFSSHTYRGAEVTLDAIAAGATDYVAKPSGVSDLDDGIERLRADMIPKIKAHAGPPPITGEGIGLRPDSPVMRLSTDVCLSGAAPVEVVCVGTSTGGPNALAELFRNIPANFPVPVLIVQHMPAVFTERLADRLDGLSSLRFHEGADGQRIEPGHAYVAPGGRHMTVERIADKTFIRLNDAPHENSCRPSVDVLFRSVAKACGKAALGVMLTGMGRDGLEGCRRIREAGGRIVTQDEASSVVWGMPGYVAQAGLADRVLPLPQLAFEIRRRAASGRNP